MPDLPNASRIGEALLPVPVRAVDAAEEQAWNEAQLAKPVGAPLACLWQYPQAAVVLGRSQQALLARLDTGRHRIVERRAGGGAVLVGPWLLGVSVVLPLEDRLLQDVSIADSYRWLGQLFVTALSRHGVDAVAVSPEQTRKAPAELAWACFAGMSPWEIAVDDRKLVGFAQRRSRHGVLLVAGALLEAVPWESLCEAMQRPQSQAAELAAATIDATHVLSRPYPIKAFAATVAGLLQEALKR